MTDKALLEIGTEEIPARLAENIQENLKETAEKKLAENRISCENIRVLGAPRRLTLILEDLPKKQAKQVEEIKGPPENIAYDDEGEPTKALEGFLRNQDLTEEELEIRETDRGRYLFAVFARDQQKTVDLLPQVFSSLIEELSFQKSMRWEDKEMSFIRPLHWICALADDKPLNFSVAGIEATPYSQGHRFLSEGKIKINCVSEYIDKLRENYVIVDPVEREELILQGIKEIEKKEQVEAEIDNKLKEEIVHLVEFPTPFYGNFDRKYLQLPEPVLVTPTREHQRYFPVRKKDGNLAAGFIGVRDGSEQYLETVITGNEEVLRARFDDAEFYFNKDLEESSQERIEKLKGLVFREELGTMYDKSCRMVEQVDFLAREIGLDSEELNMLKQATRFAKADLVSQMVREFPELQGTMGRIYARKEGKPEVVCQALEEHHRPGSADDRLPDGKIARLLSLVDKLDTLTGCFAAGLEPTGSEDPYGLRRAAIAIIRLLVALEINLVPHKLLELCLDTYQNLSLNKEEKNTVIENINSFISDRLRHRLVEQQGLKYDLVEAGIRGKTTGIPAQISRVKTLCELAEKNDEFTDLITAFNRVDSIVPEIDEKIQINSDLLLEKEEQNLYNIYWQIVESVNNLEDNEYIKLYELLTDLIEPVHDFFETVKVHSEDEKTRKNRFHLLAAIRQLMLKLGKLSRVVTE